MKIAFMTLGCKVNSYETARLKLDAQNIGWEVVNIDKEIADIYCINSCSVTNISDRKTRQMVSRAKSKNPNAVIVVLGCSVESSKESLAMAFNNANILIGNANKMDAISFIQEYITSNCSTLKIYVEDISKEKEYMDCISQTKAYDVREEVKIEDGCNNFCSYCIIPYLRGRVRSKPLHLIEEEAKALVLSGVKEIILVGIEVASYGKDFEDVNINLCSVIEALDRIPGLERIRLSSIDPRFLTEENTLRLSKVKKLCHHFHVSFQTSSDNVLKAMNRKYDTMLEKDVVLRLKKYFPDCYIASDIIVGFPGESDMDFETTYSNLSTMNLSELHVFKYSKRAYTRAARMDMQVDGNVKIQRSNKLIDLSSKCKEEFLSKYIGKTVSVLFENVKNGYLTGLTQNYMRVKVKGEESLCGTIQDVVLISLENETLIGELK